MLQSPYSTFWLEGGKEEGQGRFFETKKEAIIYAILQRDRSCWFEGWAEMHGECNADEDDDESDEEEEEDEIDESVDEWRSIDLEHADNDDEQVIQVMLLSEYNKEKERRTNILKKAYAKKLAKEDAAKMKKAKVLRKSGRVFYSFPPPPTGYDIPADVELLICNDKILNVPRKDQCHFKDEGQVAPFDLSRLAACTSIELQTTCTSSLEDIMKLTELLFASCKNNLEELHWLGSKDISYIIGSKSGPHAKECMQNLKVLSLPYASRFDPDDLMEVSKFPSLERLDLRSSFDMQHGIHTYYDNYDSDNSDKEMPYSEAFLAVCKNCEHLTEFNLGDIMTVRDGSSLFEMTLDRFVLRAALKMEINLKYD